MNKYLIKMRILAVLSLVLILFPSLAYAGTAKVFLFTNLITLANLGDNNSVQISVFSSGTDQTGNGTPLDPKAYTINRNASYQGNTPSVLIDIGDCPASTAYILLKDQPATRYAIIPASTPDIPGSDQTPSITSYLLGSPKDPKNLAVVAGYESAQATWSLDTINYQISGVDVQVATDNAFQNLINDESGNATTAAPNAWAPSSTSFVINQYVDGRTLTAGSTYYFQVRAKVAGVNPSAWVPITVPMKSGSSAPQFLSYVFKPGINFFSMPFGFDSNSRWYSFDGNGNALQYSDSLGNNTNYIVKAYDLIKAINTMAGQKVVSTFGDWDESKQQDGGILLDKNNDPDKDPAMTTLIGKVLTQGRGYQVYVTAPVTLIIKNTAQ